MGLEKSGLDSAGISVTKRRDNHSSCAFPNTSPQDPFPGFPDHPAPSARSCTNAMYSHTQYHPQPPQPPPPLQMPSSFPQPINSYNNNDNNNNLNNVASLQDQAPSSPQDDSSEIDHSNDPTPLPETRIYDGKIWALDVVQQPIRARMCGFGDKDRRPITPPPCIRLIVMDANTRKEVDINSLDTAYFVLTVDLWNLEATKEVNLVAHAQSNAPAIGQVVPASFPHTVSNPSPNQPSPRPFHELTQVPGYNRPAQNFGSPSAQHPDSAASYYSQSSGYSLYSNGGAPAYFGQAGAPYQDYRNGPPGQQVNGFQQHHSSSSFSSQGGGQGYQQYASPRQETPHLGGTRLVELSRGTSLEVSAPVHSN